MDTINAMDKLYNDTNSNLQKFYNNFRDEYLNLVSEKQEYQIKLEKLEYDQGLFLEKETKFKLLEGEYNKKLEKVSAREKEIEQQLESERKVSILKNIQTQLNQKTSELEVVNRQLALYKNRSELLNTLCVKYHINIDIGDVIKELEDAIIKYYLSCIEHNSNLVIETVSNVESNDIKEVVEIDSRTNNIELVEDIDNESLQDEGIEVVDFEYKGKSYYIDNNSGEIYEKLEDDEVGNVIGIRDSKGKVKFNKKRL